MLNIAQIMTVIL